VALGSTSSTSTGAVEALVAGPDGLTEVVVGRVGRPHGIRGEVSVEVRTDEPALRYAVGAVLRPTGGGHRSLTVRTVRAHGDRLLVMFAEVADRTTAESLRGATLVVDVEPGVRPDDSEEFYDRQLIGLRVRTDDGAPSGGGRFSGGAGGTGPEIGTVVDVRHLPAQDVLEVRLDRSGDRSGSSHEADDDVVLVPFVHDLVPSVDLDGGWLLVRAVPGLLDPDADQDASPADGSTAGRD
jgi:16S rRNA processing protein RimM